MKSLALIIPIVLINLSSARGNSSSDQKVLVKENKFQYLSSGLSLGCRTGLDVKGSQALAGFYLDFKQRNQHRLLTFDNNLWTDFNQFGLNSSISYSSQFLSISYQTDFFSVSKKFKVLPGLGVGIGFNDLISISANYHYKFDKELKYPSWTLKLVIRPSFIKVIAQNPDGSNW